MKTWLIPAFAVGLLSLSTTAGALPTSSADSAPSVATQLGKRSILQANTCVRTGVMQSTDDKSAARRIACEQVFGVLDQALDAGARDDLAPPVLDALEKWRRAQFMDAATAALPWHAGPAQVTVFPDLAPVDLPPGYQILLPADVATAARDVDGSTVRVAVLAIDASRDIVRLSIQPTGHVRKETLSPDSLLQTLTARNGPDFPLGTTPSVAETIARASDHVAWIKPPERAGNGDRNDWIYTTGHHAEPGINGLALPEIAARWVLLGSNGTLVADYKGTVPKAEAQQTAARFDAIWSTLAFRPGARYADAAASAPVSNVSLDDLVTGGQQADSTTMAQGFANAMRADEEERSSKMTEVLWKGLVLALPLIGLSLRKRKSS